MPRTHTEPIIQNELRTNCSIFKFRERFLLNAPRWLLATSCRKAKAHLLACEWSGGKETTIPSVVLVWATSYFLFLSLRGQYDCFLWTLVEMLGDVKKVPTCPFNKGKSWWRVNGTIGGSSHEARRATFTRLLQKPLFFIKYGGGVQRPNANSKLCKMVRMQVRGYRYTSPFLCIYGMPLSRPV